MLNARLLPLLANTEARHTLSLLVCCRTRCILAFNVKPREAAVGDLEIQRQ